MKSRCPPHCPETEPGVPPLSNFLPDLESGPCPTCNTDGLDSVNKQRLVRNAFNRLGMNAALSRGNTTTRVEIVAVDDDRKNLYVVRTNWGELNPEDVRRLAFDDLPSIAPIAVHDGLGEYTIIPLIILENDPGRIEGATFQLCKGLEQWPKNRRKKPNVQRSILWMRLDEMVRMIREGTDWKDLDLSSMKLSDLSTSE